jgi:hypothetical protein
MIHHRSIREGLLLVQVPPDRQPRGSPPPEKGGTVIQYVPLTTGLPVNQSWQRLVACFGETGNGFRRIKEIVLEPKMVVVVVVVVARSLQIQRPCTTCCDAPDVRVVETLAADIVSDGHNLGQFPS